MIEKYNEIGMDEKALAEIQKMMEEGTESVNSSGLGVGEKQILIVTQYSIITSNHISSPSTNQALSSTVVMLTGKASPHSNQNLFRAYITFVEDGTKLRRPVFISGSGLIYLFMHQKQLESVLAQLKEPNIYCWIKLYPDGQLYSDVHTDSIIHRADTINTNPLKH